MGIRIGGMIGIGSHGGLRLAGGGGYEVAVLGIAPANLLAYWPLNETSGSVASDISGNGRNGSYSASVVIAGSTFLTGDPAPILDGNDAINVYSTSLRDAFNGAEGSMALWCKPTDLAVWTNATLEYLFGFYADNDNRLQITKPDYANHSLSGEYRAGGVTDAPGHVDFVTAAWYHAMLTWSKSNERVRCYVNGRPASSYQSNNLGTFVGQIASTVSVLGALVSSGTNGIRGALAHAALWDTELTAAQALTLVSPLLSDRGLFVIGDSKSTSSYQWPEQLRSRLNELGSYNYVESPTRFATGGYTAALMHTYIDTNLAAASGTAHTATINLGANDVNSVPAEATWKADMVGIIDPIRARWPGVKIYVAKAWRRDYGTECDTLAGWIDDIVALYPSGVYVGQDERGWMEGGDDGATMTSDGTHYSAAGVIQCATEWRNVITA